MKARRINVLLLMSLLLSGCGNNNHETVDKDKPVLNPEPKYFMTITGNYNEAVQKKFPLKITAQYYTTNDKCRINGDAAAFEGATTYREKNDSYAVLSNQSGKFILKIALDKYLPGFCGWTPLNISYELLGSKLDKNPIAYFDDSVHKFNKTLVAMQEIQCGELSDCKFSSAKPFQTNLSTNGNYEFKINIK